MRHTKPRASTSLRSRARASTSRLPAGALFQALPTSKIAYDGARARPPRGHIRVRLYARRVGRLLRVAVTGPPRKILHDRPLRSATEETAARRNHRTAILRHAILHVAEDAPGPGPRRALAAAPLAPLDLGLKRAHGRLEGLDVGLRHACYVNLAARGHVLDAGARRRRPEVHGLRVRRPARRARLGADGPDARRRARVDVRGRVGLRRGVVACVEINQCVACTRSFFIKSFLGDEATVLAPSSGE